MNVHQLSPARGVQRPPVVLAEVNTAEGSRGSPRYQAPKKDQLGPKR